MPTILTATEELQQFVADPMRRIVARLGKNQGASDLIEIDSTNVQECDFPGYVPIELQSWTVEADASEDCAVGNSELAEFVAGPIVIPQQATFAYLTISYNGGAHKLLNYWPLSSPFSFSGPGDKFAFNGKIISLKDLP